MIKVKRVEPVLIAVKEIDKATAFFRDVLGARFRPKFEEEDHMLAPFTLGETYLELAEPLIPDGPIDKFIKRKGEGVYCLSIQVDDLDSTITELESLGIHVPYRQVLEKPLQTMPGTTWKKVAATDPKDTFGVLLYLGETVDEK
ncbi:MAG: VOC family protein [Candidatus Tectomicrobia bacterium]|uniref:VOC family protein n=1 Tax=Tectimicrobiota bacterium TaxID=2528274 RepID=A0A933LPU8_UNCTE|nr:VOC family protein [Candidatus Tectomicrobia bacterium]